MEQELREKIEGIIYSNSPCKPDLLLVLIEEAGWVKLADDQSLSEEVKKKLGYSPDIDKGQRSLIDNGWRKVELEVKDGSKRVS